MQDSLFKKPPAGAPAVESVQSVSKVVDYIKRIISQNKTLAGLRVRGEVSGLNRQPNGRIYFDLKEGAAILKCIAWPSDATKLPPFKNGDEVIAGGDYGIYAERSQYELFVKSIELSGIGILYAQFEALKKRFREEGLFEAERKRAFPEFPRRVALVSARGKGAEDFLQTIAKRAPFVDVEVIETRVQGDGAEIDIGAAIDKASRLEVDVIVVTRGGGSYEDLFPFNREPVVRAIVRAKRPVLSAIGHAQDVHLSDYAADHVCETPSNAAHFFGEIGDRFMTRVERARTRIENQVRVLLNTRAQRFDLANLGLSRAMRDVITTQEQRVRRLEKRLDQVTPERRLRERRERLTALDFRLQQAGTSRVRTALQRFEILQTRLRGADPDVPLERGYAIVTFHGRAVRDVSAVPDGARIEAKVKRGRLAARVEEKLPDG